MGVYRPKSGGHIPLDDEDLAAIGLAVVYESGAKSAVGAALRALANLSFANWKKAERLQFSQLIERIHPHVFQLEDEELTSRFTDLRQALENGHELRHIIVHVCWGEGGNSFLGRDFSRDLTVLPEHILHAVEACAEIKRASHWFALRVGELIIEGKIAERKEGPGMKIMVRDQWVRL